MRYLIFSIMLYITMPAHAQQTAGNNAALPDTTKFNSVCRVDSVVAWAVADSGRIYRQTTAGWTRIAVDGIKDYKLNSVFALKEQLEYVWIVGTNENNGQNKLLKTIDGREKKQRWISIALLPCPGSISKVEFTDRLQGYIYGEERLLMQSHDGGETWVRVPGGQKQ